MLSEPKRRLRVIFDVMLAACKCRNHNVPILLHCLQANFACITCSVCGLIYAKGEANDEKVHALFHANCTQGVNFQVPHFGVTTNSLCILL